MALKFNDTTIERVIYNGTDLDKVIYNGTVVFEKNMTVDYTISFNLHLYSEDNAYEVMQGCNLSDFIANNVFVMWDFENIQVTCDSGLSSAKVDWLNCYLYLTTRNDKYWESRDYELNNFSSDVLNKTYNQSVNNEPQVIVVNKDLELEGGRDTFYSQTFYARVRLQLTATNGISQTVWHNFNFTIPQFNQTNGLNQTYDGSQAKSLTFSSSV